MFVGVVMQLDPCCHQAVQQHRVTGLPSTHTRLLVHRIGNFAGVVPIVDRIFIQWVPTLIVAQKMAPVERKVTVVML
jgi:hypothetical protein